MDIIEEIEELILKLKPGAPWVPLDRLRETADLLPRVVARLRELEQRAAPKPEGRATKALREMILIAKDNPNRNGWMSYSWVIARCEEVLKALAENVETRSTVRREAYRDAFAEIARRLDVGFPTAAREVRTWAYDGSVAPRYCATCGEAKQRGRCEGMYCANERDEDDGWRPRSFTSTGWRPGWWRRTPPLHCGGHHCSFAEGSTLHPRCVCPCEDCGRATFTTAPRMAVGPDAQPTEPAVGQREFRGSLDDDQRYNRAPEPWSCEHANEVPSRCPCKPDCYCRQYGHTCNPKWTTAR